MEKFADFGRVGLNTGAAHGHLVRGSANNDHLAARILEKC